MSQPTFRDLERAGWAAKAGVYDDYFAKITQQAIDAILDGLGDLKGKRLLDVACGTGHLTGAAAARGADAEGIDFAAPMVAQAADNYPDCTFTEGDAEHLPYEDARFDAVACSFGLLHLEDADTAIREAYRVLRPGGRYAFTVWRSPEQGSEMHKIILGAINDYGTLEVDLPPAPPIFRFAEPEECARALQSTGFTSVKTKVLPLEWRGPSPEAFMEMVNKSAVRMLMVLDAQNKSARKRVIKAILEGAEARRKKDEIIIAFPAMMVAAARPD
ncbi:MAG: methyltransferase domain-containing protein [Gammaproteobacteria bacterium]|nr:methyltransferase domain-containing protein [Gammaproteobacteria bacterium]MDH3413850.1 methyltransferase domain-containing protein [Gammaproteobacteria bacterium]